MNNIEHHFLGGSGLLAPERWRQAFPAGQIHAIGEISAPCSPTWQGLLWLSCDDSHWQTHLARVRQLVPGVKLILLSSAPNSHEGLLALDAGARGYTHASAVPELLREVAIVVVHGGLWVGPELLQRLVGSTVGALAKRMETHVAAPIPNAWYTLSAREAQVARLISTGHSNKEVAYALFISERTVKAHLGAVFEKLGVRDRLQLVLRLAASPDPGPHATHVDA